MAKLKKRADGRFAASIYLGRDEDGKKRYKTVYARNLSELAQKEAQLRVELGKGLDGIPEHNRFALWASDFLRIKTAANITNRQKDRYHTAVDFWERTFPGWAIQDIHTEDLERALLGLAEQGLSQRTIAFYRSAIRQILQRAMGRVIFDNPERHLTRDFGAIGKPQVPRRALTKEEQQWFWDTPHRGQPVAIIILLSGLRRGELAALTWDDIDLEAATIRVNKVIEYDAKGLPMPRPYPKSDAGNRIVDIPPQLVDYLQKMPRNGNLVVPAASGGVMTASGWVKLWSSYMRALNAKYGHRTPADEERAASSKPGPKTYDMTIPPITLHWLRHTYCTLLYFAGVDVMQTSAQMGHADISTTLRIYTHLDATHKRQAASKLGNYLATGSGEKPAET